MSTTPNLSQKNLDWMILAGVGVDDVDWLKQMNDSLELHSPAHRQRVETIYTRAMSGVLGSSAPLDFIQKISSH